MPSGLFVAEAVEQKSCELPTLIYVCDLPRPRAPLMPMENYFPFPLMLKIICSNYLIDIKEHPKYSINSKFKENLGKNFQYF